MNAALQRICTVETLTAALHLFEARKFRLADHTILFPKQPFSDCETTGTFPDFSILLESFSCHWSSPCLHPWPQSRPGSCLKLFLALYVSKSCKIHTFSVYVYWPMPMLQATDGNDDTSVTWSKTSGSDAHLGLLLLKRSIKYCKLDI